MTATVVHPAEMERMLQARVDAARTKRPRLHRPSARNRSRPFRGSRLVLTTAVMLAFSAAAVWASHGGSLIDLTADGAQVEHNDAVFTQGGTGAGTGQFDPYLTLSPGGSADTETGYNVCTEPVFGFSNASIDCPDPEFDEQTGGDRTHELLVSSIPVVEFDGALYREFHLDSNDSGSDPWMAITVIELYTETDPDLTFAEFTASGDLIWALDGDGDQTILMNTQSLESGSGVSDISILVPNDLFPADCFYGATDCETFLYFYTESGDPDLDTGDGRNWNTTAGFEEWRIELLPVVQVNKDVEISFDRTFPWDVQKEADGEPDVINLFAGQTATINWTVTATVGTPTDGNVSITGEIDILNPTGPGFAISDSIDAVVTDVDDVLTLGGVNTTADVTCPDPFPFTVGPGDTVTCTYSADPSSTDDGTNEATVTIETNEAGDTQEYTDTAVVDFDDATVNEIDECVEVTDDNATPGNTADDEELDDELCAGDSPGVYPDSNTVGPFTVDNCGSTSVTNTARTETNDTGTVDTDPDTVTVNCYELTVAKTVNEALTRNFTWTIDKTVTPTSIDMFDGAPETDVDWSITPTRSAGTDSGWMVSGTITINNPAPIAASGVSVTDVIDHPSLADVNATVDCDPVTAGNQTTVNVAASSSAQCTYTAALSNGDDRTNTATATLAGIGYNSAAEAIDFDGATVTETNEAATVTDPTLGINQAAVSGVAILVDGGATCPDDEGNHPNTATVTPNDGGPLDTDDAEYVVNCHQLTVSKTAVTTFTRDYDWDVTKERVLAPGEVDGDGDLTTLVLDEGQTYTLTYRIVVSTTGFTDSNWAVSGTITVNNPAPIAASGVSVSDVIDHPSLADVNATVDCDPVTSGNQTTVNIAASGSANCTYSAPLSNADARTNVATATLFGVDYDSSGVAVTFDNTPDVEIDECVSVTDDKGTPANAADDTVIDASLCIGELDDDADGNVNTRTYTHTINVGPFAACGPQVLTNTVHIVTVDDSNDTGESHSDSFTVNIDVPCPEGCTLTQGYWKTHNDTFQGGAPADDTWFLLGDVDGDGVSEGELETFFLSNNTYFAAMWTAPGGNAYYQLARQYIAAVLNTLDGADAPPAVDAAIAAAETLFETYTPAQVAAAKGKNGKELRAQFTTLAGTLASFNEGLVGPGHCDEDATSAVTGGSPLLADRRISASIG